MTKRLVALGLCLTLILGCTREKIVYVEKPDEEPTEDLMKLGERVVLETSEEITGRSDGYHGYEFDLSGLAMVTNRTVSEFKIVILSMSDCGPDVWAWNNSLGAGDQVSFDESWLGYGCHPVIIKVPVFFRWRARDVRDYIDSNGTLVIWGRYLTWDLPIGDLPTLTAYRYDPRYRETWLDINPVDYAIQLVTDSDDFYTLGLGGIYQVSESGGLIDILVPVQHNAFWGLAIGGGRLWASRHDSIFVFGMDGTALGRFDYPVYFGTSITFFNGELLVAGIESKQNFIYVLDADSSLNAGEAVVKRIITGLPGPIVCLTSASENLLIYGAGGKFYLVDRYGLRLREYERPFAGIHGMCAVGDVLYILHTGAVGYNYRGGAISPFAL